jgi:glycosyltransferase involved in cell wall biosynthesis
MPGRAPWGTAVSRSRDVPPAPDRPLRIAMIGQKGLPATFGGIEHHVENIGRRLADRGHEVTVYCRSTYAELPGERYLGMRTRPAPTVGTKHLDAIVHSATSTAMAMAAGVDVVHYHGIGPAMVGPLPKVFSRAKVVLTVHGLDHQRAKWNPAAKAVLGTAHRMSGRVPDRLVVVSEELVRHYRERFGVDAAYICNGVTTSGSAGPDAVRQHGLEPGRYALFVGRLVPEKRPDQLIRAFRRLEGDLQLAVVGDSSFSDDYSKSLRELAAPDPRIVFTGFAYGETLGALYEQAGVFVQPSALEGLPLTLLEAVSHDVPTLVTDLPAHLEVVGAGSQRHRVVPVDDEEALGDELRRMLTEPPSADHVSRSVRASVIQRYSWDRAVDELEAVYRDLLETGHPTVAPPLEQAGRAGARQPAD